MITLSDLTNSMPLQSRGAASALKGQWQNPGDILSLLLLVGPDVVQKALAQLTGTVVAPVAFSFGWVAYAFTSLALVFGSELRGESRSIELLLMSHEDGCLMPAAEDSAILVNARGHQRDNSSWTIELNIAQMQKP